MKTDGFFPYGLGVLKEMERRSYPGTITLLVLTGLVTAGLSLILDSSVLLWLYGAYLLAMLIWQLWLAAQPEQVGPVRLVVGIALGLLSCLFYTAGVGYLLSLGSQVASLMGILAIVGAMLYTVGVRAEATLSTYLDVGNSTVMLALIPLSFRYHGAPPEIIAMVLVAVLLTWLIFICMIFRVARERARARMIGAREAQREKLLSLGQLTGGVAHDFNNLLTVILGNLEIGREMGPGPEREALMGEVEDAAQRARSLTRQLLSFSRRTALEPEPLEAGKVIAEVEKLIGRLLPATHQLETMRLAQVPVFLADRGMLQSVIVNMVVNARDAMPDGGVIRIALDRVDLGSRRGAAQPADLAAGSYVRISICDTGTGIPKKIQNRIFEPYFTTKAPGKGSGLGLAMALGFAEQSGGGLTFETREGQGTDIHLWFPAAS